MTQAPASFRLAALVVTYNRKAQIETTVTRLLGEPVDHLVVVDNGSTDGSREWLSVVDDPRLTVLLPEENLGGAGGFELGLRHVTEVLDPDWTVVMDDDARPEPGALAEFRATNLIDWDGVVAAVRFPGGDICGMNRPVLNPFSHWRVFLKTVLGGGNRAAFHLGDAAYASDATVPVDGASFVGLFLSRDTIQRAGFPDGRLFIYAEDGLYTLGLTQAGGRLGFFPQIRFEHDCSTFAGPSGQFNPPWKAYYYHRNLLFLYRRAAGIWFWPVLLIVLPKWLLKARRYRGAARAEFLRFLRAAVVDGLRGRRRRLTLPAEET